MGRTLRRTYGESHTPIRQDEYRRTFRIKMWKPLAKFPTECKLCLRTLKQGLYRVCEDCLEREGRANNNKEE